MSNGRFHDLFGGPPAAPEGQVEQRHMDVARSIQVVTEEVMLRLASHARELTGEKSLPGGRCALNCVANGLILREQIFERLWIQPAAGDAGGALGAAYCAWYAETKRSPSPAPEWAQRLDARCSAGPGVFGRGDRGGASKLRSGLPATGPGAVARTNGRAAPGGESGRLVSGPDGVWPARAGQPFHPRRCRARRGCSR